MNDEARIRALVEEGKITADQAEQLLEALRDIDDAGGANGEHGADGGQGVGRERSDAGASPGDTAQGPVEQPDASSRAGFAAGPKARPGAQAEAGSVPTEAEAQERDGAGKHIGPWVRIELSAGDLRVSADPAIDKPLVDADVDVKQEGDDFVIRGKEDFPLSGLFGKAAHGDVDIKVPANCALDIRAAAGDIDIDGVRFVKGKITGGDVRMAEVGGIDVVAISGDVEISVKPTSGNHYLKATSGDVEVKLLPGSSVDVSGSAMSGDVRLPRSFQTHGRFMSKKFSGRVGSGNARLKLQIVAGSLEIEAHDE